MAECATVEFDAWLKATLIKLNTDDEVFSSYIKGILDTDDTEEEKTEALQGIICEITDNNIDELCSDILAKWSTGLSAAATTAHDNVTTESLDNQLAKLMEQQATCLPLAAQRAATTSNTDQAALKKAILAQYAQVSGDEDEDDDAGGDVGGGGASGGLMMKNTNAAAVDQEVKQKREQNKEEHKLKKDKDKEEREKQKAKADERKDKEKKRTQKGERKR